MNLAAIIDEIANQADDFLAGVTDRAQARAGISELLTMDYSGLPSADRKTVTEGVLAVLESEGFFNVSSSGDAWSEDGDATEGTE